GAKFREESPKPRALGAYDATARSPCPTIANRRRSGEVAGKIQAHVIATNSYRAGARVIVLTHFAEEFVCSDTRRCCCCYRGRPSRKSTSITRSPSGKNYRMMIALRT